MKEVVEYHGYEIKLNDADLDPVIGGLDVIPDSIREAVEHIGDDSFVPKEDDPIHPMSPRPERPVPNPFGKSHE